jgi:hypothetical protein
MLCPCGPILARCRLHSCSLCVASAPVRVWCLNSELAAAAPALLQCLLSSPPARGPLAWPVTPEQAMGPNPTGSPRHGALFTIA